MFNWNIVSEWDVAVVDDTNVFIALGKKLFIYYEDVRANGWMKEDWRRSLV